MHLKTLISLFFITCVAFAAAVPSYAQTPAKQAENTIGMKLTLVLAGNFLMGAEEDPSNTLTAFPYARREWLVGSRSSSGIQEFHHRTI